MVRGSGLLDVISWIWKCFARQPTALLKCNQSSC